MTNITAEHRASFEALVSGDYDNFALFSCFVNGQPAAASVAVNRDGAEYTISPLFVALTAEMVLTDHEGQPCGAATGARTMTPPLTPKDCVAAFIKRLAQLDPEKSSYDKFRDFCEMGFCAFAKLTASAPERAQGREDRYMQIVATYRNKDTVRAYPELLALASVAIPQGCDFLGSVASEMQILNARIGQFFTPYDVARMMATMSFHDAADIIGRNGFLSIQEPASGAGGMVLAVADELTRQGFDPGLHLLVNAIDLSPLCFHMTYVQLTLRGIPALVECGNTLSGERFDRAWTPAALAFYRQHGRLFPEAVATDPDAEPVVAGEQLVLL